jgi:hypothetical protein
MAEPDLRLPIQGGFAGVSPMIWRRILLPGDQAIADLHYTTQIAMGWSNSQLNRFHILRQGLRGRS